MMEDGMESKKERKEKRKKRGKKREEEEEMASLIGGNASQDGEEVPEERQSCSWTPGKVLIIAGALTVGVACVVATILVVVLSSKERVPDLKEGLYLFSTYHDTRNILVYTLRSGPRQGGDRGPDEGWLTAANQSQPRSLLGSSSQLAQVRQMALLPFDGSLLVAQFPTVYRLPYRCSGQDGGVLIRLHLEHPYGIAYSSRSGYVYVTNQNSNSITRYNASTGVPIEKSFASLAAPRGIAIDNEGMIYVAVRDEDVVAEYAEDGGRLRTWAVRSAINVIVWRGFLFAGGAGEDLVRVIHLRTGATNATLTHEKLEHPSGMAIVDDRILLVMSQDTRAILAWRIGGEGGNNGGGFFQPLGVWVDGLPSAPEGLLVVQCP